jgi:phage-related protein
MAYEAKFVIAAENRVKEATDAAQKDFEGFGGKVKEALSTITVTAGDVMNAIKGVSSTVTEWINAYAEDERALITLKTALEATGQASGNAVGKLTSFASSLQAVTGIGDDATIALSARLIASGLSVEQTMKLIKAAADYSAATGEDFNSTVDNLQRTLSGTAGRISGFIPELKGLSKEQLQSGAAIDLVAEKYGGFAEKLVGTASVSLATFNAAWGDMKEALGSAIMPAVQPVLESFTKFITDTVIPVLQSFAPYVKEAFTAIQDIITAFRPIVEPVLNWFADVWKTTIGPNINTVWDIVKNVIQLITAAISGDWSKAWESAKKIVNDAIDIIKRAFTPLTKAATAVWDGVKATWTTVWEGLKNVVKSAVDAIAGFFKPIIDMVNTVLGGIEKALQFVSGEKRVGNYLVDKNNKIIGEYITKNGVETLVRYASGTSGAAPGWALVGERGPELVFFNGGETVIPNHELRGYAEGTGGVFGVSVPWLGDVFEAIGGVVEKFWGLISVISSLEMVLNPVTTILQAALQVIQPMLDTILTPIVGILQILGQTIGQLLLPILQALAPVVKFLGDAFVWLYNNVIAPVGNLIYKTFATIWNAIASALNSLLGWLGVHLGTIDTSVSVLQKIDAGALQTAGAGVVGQTAAQSANYRSQSITINIYQEAPVVGSGGMTEFARIIRGEFERLGYYGA